MPRYEYKTIPAPTKGRKGKGVKGPQARFAFALEGVMNDMAAEGWDYQRTETLPSVERSGLASTTTQWRNIMVFRRVVEEGLDAFAPELLPAPEAAELDEDMVEEDVEDVIEADDEEDDRTER